MASRTGCSAAFCSAGTAAPGWRSAPGRKKAGKKSRNICARSWNTGRSGAASSALSSIRGSRAAGSRASFLISSSTRASEREAVQKRLDEAEKANTGKLSKEAAIASLASLGAVIESGDNAALYDLVHTLIEKVVYLNTSMCPGVRPTLNSRKGGF